ncbi:MAG TPA: plastocyanin/azurin family copper-binding protein [Actinomycetota bacterium]
MRRAVAIASVLFVLGSCSDDGGREIRVEMFEMGYDPERIEVVAGETVTFVVENTGFAAHEFFIGNEEEQASREALLAAGGTPPDEDSIIVENGETGEITYTFGGQGEILFGCHLIGHFAAGMVGTIVVSAPSG